MSSKLTNGARTMESAESLEAQHVAPAAVLGPAPRSETSPAGRASRFAAPRPPPVPAGVGRVVPRQKSRTPPYRIASAQCGAQCEPALPAVQSTGGLRRLGGCHVAGLAFALVMLHQVEHACECLFSGGCQPPPFPPAVARRLQLTSLTAAIELTRS